MPFSINLRSDNDSADAIRSLWQQCSFLEESPSMVALDYPPHITLAVYDDIDTDELFAAHDSVFEGVSQIAVRFDRLGYFIAPHAIILWAAPRLPDAVRSIHNHIHRLLTAELCRPPYRSATWIPHCSLATTIDSARKADAIDFANQSISPFEVVFDVADCASFMPVEVLMERQLLVGASKADFTDTIGDA